MSGSRPEVPIPALLSILALGLSADAQACSCADESPVSVPAHDALGVPLNVRPMWLYETSAPLDEALVVREDTSGVAIASTTTWAESRGRQGYAFVTLSEPLDPETVYTVSDGTVVHRFTTGSERDDTAPDTPGVTSQQTIASPETFEVECGVFQTSSCGSSVFAWVDVAAADEEVLYEVEVVPDTDEGLVMTAFSLTDSIFAGEGACLSNMSRLNHEDGGTLRMRAIDLAGNAGPWTDDWHFTLDWPQAPECTDDQSAASEGCGCATGAAGPGGLALWLLVVLGAVRRRAIPRSSPAPWSGASGPRRAPGGASTGA